MGAVVYLVVAGAALAAAVAAWWGVRLLRDLDELDSRLARRLGSAPGLFLVSDRTTGDGPPAAA